MSALTPRAWYGRYGVEEYYEHDPDRGTLAGWLRQGSELVPIPVMPGWVSPRLGVRFGLEGADLVLIGPDGVRFESYVAQVEGREHERARAVQAEEQAALAREQAQQERARAEQAETLAAQAEERAQRLAARLRELGLAEE